MRFDDTGASLIEWGLLVSLIALVALLAVAFVGQDTSSLMSQISDGFP